MPTSARSRILPTMALTLALGALGGVGWGLSLGWHALLAGPLFAIDRVEVTGTDRISEQRLVERLTLSAAARLPTLDLDAVAQALLSDPWVGRVTVRRAYPDTLRVRIWEREPAALLIRRDRDGHEVGVGLMVDRTGVVLGPPDAALNLPRVTGMDTDGMVSGDHVDVATLGLALRIAYAAPTAATGVVDVHDPLDPLLLLPGMRVRVGVSGDYTWRLARLSGLSRELRRVGGDRGMDIDLRFGDRVIARAI